MLEATPTIHRMEPEGCSSWWEPLQRVLTVASPKSPILTAVRSSVKKMLFDLRSRWIMFFACR